MTINTRIVTRRIANNYKHKRCKMKTTKIKIMTNKRVSNSCNEEKGKGKR
jgi:hypothetical protein